MTDASKLAMFGLALVALPPLTQVWPEAQPIGAEKPLKRSRPLATAGALDASSGPSDRPRGPNHSPPADLDDQLRPGARGATGAIMVGTTGRRADEEPDDLVVTQDAPRRFAGSSEISTDQ